LNLNTHLRLSANDKYSYNITVDTLMNVSTLHNQMNSYWFCYVTTFTLWCNFIDCSLSAFCRPARWAAAC